MSTFEYSADEINKIISESGLQKVCMRGTLGDLARLKPVVEEVYDKHVFYLSYWESECPYHGWSWAKDDGSMKNQKEITDGITQKFRELYALILAGLGQECQGLNRS